MFLENNRLKYDLEVNSVYRLKVEYTSVVKKKKKKSLLKKYLAELSSLNFRLHAELKEVLEKQLEGLPFMPLGTDIPADEGIVRNLQEQLQLMNQVCEMKYLYCLFLLLCLGRLGEVGLFLGSEFICLKFLETILRPS